MEHSRVSLHLTDTGLYGIEEDGARARVVSMDAAGRSDKAPARLPWWGHVIVLSLILGGTGLSIITGNPLYAVVLVVTAWIIGTWFARAGRRVNRPAELGVTAGVVVLAIAGALAVALMQRPGPVAPAGTPVSYCVQVGDDNCDGMIVPSESGWVCVPPAGGPLVCPAGHDPNKYDTAAALPTMGRP